MTFDLFINTILSRMVLPAYGVVLTEFLYKAASSGDGAGLNSPKGFW